MPTEGLHHRLSGGFNPLATICRATQSPSASDTSRSLVRLG